MRRRRRTVSSKPAQLMSSLVNDHVIPILRLHQGFLVGIQPQYTYFRSWFITWNHYLRDIIYQFLLKPVTPTVHYVGFPPCFMKQSGDETLSDKWTWLWRTEEQRKKLAHQSNLEKAAATVMKDGRGLGRTGNLAEEEAGRINGSRERERERQKATAQPINAS